MKINGLLMFFPDHAQGVAEFFRVLKRGGRAAVSVITSPRRSIHGRIQAAIAQHFASRATAVAHSYALGEERTLRRLFEGAGFQDIETCGETRGFPFPSFDAFFDPIEQGTGYIGQEWITLSHDVQHLVREDVRRELEGTDGR